MANSYDWYYNSYLGEITQMIGPWAAITVHSGIGWHGPFANEDAARKFYEDGKAANPGWKSPVSNTNVVGIAGNVASSVGDIPGEAASAIKNAEASAAKAALSPLQEELKLWAVRISEILLGLVLIGVGLAAVTGQANTISRFIQGKTKAGIGSAVKGIIK